MFNMYTFDEFLSLSLIRARKKKKYRIFDMLMMFTFENQPGSKSDPHFFLKIKSQLNNILLLYYRFFYKYWKKSSILDLFHTGSALSSKYGWGSEKYGG